ncbi:hypothetical protein KSP40_PGU017596 [Platanthera guangdongensis]|uniref:Transmembrane protein n=1 Tax=Platanthera guangdongensis TaxID=2320717 RepID=A0ABR2MZH2_9ASPA
MTARRIDKNSNSSRSGSGKEHSGSTRKQIRQVGRKSKQEQQNQRRKSMQEQTTNQQIWASQVAKQRCCKKPSRMTLYWFHYTCGAVGLSACSLWVLRHSRLMGSSDIDNWIRAAKESTTLFWEEHVEQPV